MKYFYLSVHLYNVVDCDLDSCDDGNFVNLLLKIWAVPSAARLVLKVLKWTFKCPGQGSSHFPLINCIRFPPVLKATLLEISSIHLWWNNKNRSTIIYNQENANDRSCKRMYVCLETPKTQHVRCKYKYPMKSKFD